MVVFSPSKAVGDEGDAGSKAKVNNAGDSCCMLACGPARACPRLGSSFMYLRTFRLQATARATGTTGEMMSMKATEAMRDPCMMCIA